MSATSCAVATGAALIHYGVIFFMLEKLGAVSACRTCTSTRRCAARRSKKFQKTRNAPGALYSVAGQDAAPQAWDRDGAKPS